MKAASAQLAPFQGYLGKRVSFESKVAEIVDIEVRGRTVCFVGKESGSDLEFLVPLRCLLEHLIDESAQPSADPEAAQNRPLQATAGNASLRGSTSK